MPKTNSSGPRGWDPIAPWYDGWVGQVGSEHHQKLAIPALLELLSIRPGERVLDLGAGQGVLAPYIVREKALYTGVEISRRLIGLARRRHGRQGPLSVRRRSSAARGARSLCGKLRRRSLPTQHSGHEPSR